MNKQQEKNLRKLADGLLNLPVNYKHFDMLSYFRLESGTVGPACAGGKELLECGTVACAAGHGPSFGIEVERGEIWIGYIQRVFRSGSYEWCFSDQWAKEDNTPQGAALRILYMLDCGGIPEGFNSHNISKTDVSLYTNAYNVVEV